MSILPKDISYRFPHLFVIPASAGSGKTYTLSHRYVQFLLSRKIHPNGIRNILAITFTKLAAKEMKERILSVLKNAALHDERTLEELSALTELSREDIAVRSEHLTQEILRNYSDFNVRTIDSFLTTVFTASSLELGVQPNVTIEFDHDAILDRAFRQYSQNLREGAEEMKFVDGLISLIETNETMSKGFLWNPFSKIVREVRELQKQFGRSPSDPLLVDGDERLRTLKKTIVAKAEKLRGMLEESTLPVNNYFLKDIARLAGGEVLEIASKGKTKKYFNKYSDDAGAAREIKRLFTVIRPLEKALDEYLTVYAHTYYQPFVRAVSLVGNSIRNVKLLEGTVVIDDINRMLARYLSSDSVPEVYLKLGERISHFMIDEFQDTSPIQWKNLQPLIEEALSKQGTLFAVGDTKQSIYGFRGADWHIFRDLIEGKYFPSAPPVVLPLTKNFRSAQALVDCVKEIFSVNVAAAGFEAHAAASGLYNFAQDVPDAERNKGYVEIRLIDNTDADAGASARRRYIVSTIQDCLLRKYSYGDIAVLTQTNADVVEISSWLNHEGIPFLSLSTLDIRKRKIIGEIIAILRFLDSPIDNLSFTTFITGKIFRGSAPHMDSDRMHAFLVRCRNAKTENYYRSFRASFETEWERYFDRLFSLVGYLPLYDLVSEVYKTFSVFETCPAEESALIKLLECVKEFENSGSNSLKDFLTFSTEEGSDFWSIQIPGTVRAVRIMTVHKAKGLGFPVTIVSLKEKRSKANSMVTVDTDKGLSVLRVSKNYGERNTTLGDIYDDRAAESVIDDLNKIYVALTRARNEMYVTALYKKKENLPAAILNEKVFGAKYSSAEKEKAETTLPLIPSLYRTDRSALPVAQYEKIGVHETRRGDLIHEMLSRIEYCDYNIDGAVRSAVSGISVPTEFDGETEISNLVRFLEKEEIRRYFTAAPGRSVLREQDVTSSSGRLFRLDRIIIDINAVTVVDFKTGSDENIDDHRTQVRQYTSLMKELYPDREIAGVLLYFDLGKGVPVE
jgi:ATP-dependent exoDNAse (exonuclease V) beta subunit